MYAFQPGGRPHTVRGGLRTCLGYTFSTECTTTDDGFACIALSALSAASLAASSARRALFPLSLDSLRSCFPCWSRVLIVSWVLSCCCLSVFTGSAMSAKSLESAETCLVNRSSLPSFVVATFRESKYELRSFCAAIVESWDGSFDSLISATFCSCCLIAFACLLKYPSSLAFASLALKPWRAGKEAATFRVFNSWSRSCLLRIDASFFRCLAARAC
mmetsp:Transcript_25780/g.51690  ORF Transcript_25780/g.51690 Transcript_25780/m.51690 type:complete len:217 (-) Transcript_25780:223-873(-)